MTKLGTVNNSTGRKLSSAVLFFVGTTASLATVLGFFGANWWGWDRLADWRFPLMVVLFATSIVYGLVFRRAISAVFLLAAIINAVLLAPLWLSTQAAAASNDRVRVVSFDTSGSDDRRNDIATWIDSVEADVALLYRTTGDWADTLVTAGVPYRIVPAALGSEALGQAIVLVRRGIAVTPLDPVPGSDLTLLVDVGGTPTKLVGLAVQNPGSTFESDQRVARFTSINTTVAESTEPVVVAGNLETSRWSHAFDVITNGLNNSEDGFGYAATWPRTDPPLIGTYMGLPLDHALYRGNITVPVRRVGPDLGPAHRPLLFDISPAAG
jgi:endonuclease/exonuclease/phosphatase (EEP) superfamily protein YafD